MNLPKIKYRFLLILLILVSGIIWIPSPFSYLHYEYPTYFLYFLIVWSCAFIYIFPSKKFILVEKIIYTILISSIGLIIGTYATEALLKAIYGYDSNYDLLKSPTLVENITFYGFGYLISSGVFYFWQEKKSPVYR